MQPRSETWLQRTTDEDIVRDEISVSISHIAAESGGNQLLLTGLTITFLKEFGLGLRLSSPLWLSLAAVITLLGQIAGKTEGWSHFDSFYWSFITATTVGYGDFRPVKRASRIIAIVIALLGLTLTGILIAVGRSEEHTSELQSRENLVCRLLLEKKK